MIKGFWFPFRAGTTAFPEEASDANVIKGSIIQILTTGYGERIMRPTFGSRVFDFIFENSDELLQILIEREVRSSLNAWEPRIRVEEVKAEIEKNIPGMITVSVLYTVLSSNQYDSVTVSGSR